MSGPPRQGGNVVVVRTFHAVGDGTSSHSRGRTRHLRRARHVQRRGNVGSPAAPRGAGRRSRHSTPRTGKPATRGRAAGVLKLRRGGTRDAERRNRAGNHPRPRQTRTAAGGRLSTVVQPRTVSARL